MIKFKNEKLREEALTHKSKANETKGEAQNNERLEFLGDAVLQFVVSKELFTEFPDKQEGYLTLLRANIVGNDLNLAEVAAKLKLGQMLILGKGEESEGGREKPSILANALEALIGAIFLDQGLEAAEDFIKGEILTSLPDKLIAPLKHPKSTLQEILQSRSLGTPQYRMVSESGPDHKKDFVVEVSINDKVIGAGSGPNKSRAQEAAAASALERIVKKR